MLTSLINLILSELGSGDRSTKRGLSIWAQR